MLASSSIARESGSIASTWTAQLVLSTAKPPSFQILTISRTICMNGGAPPSIISNTLTSTSVSIQWSLISAQNLWRKSAAIQTTPLDSTWYVFVCAREPLALKLTDYVKSANFTEIATQTDDELATVGDKWFKLLDEFGTSTPLLIFRTGLLKMAFSYSRLVALSFGLQHAKEDHWDENSFLMRVGIYSQPLLVFIVSFLPVFYESV